GADRAGARALVEDLLSIAGATAFGARTAGEIADRYLEQADARAGDRLDPARRAALLKFLAIRTDPDAAGDAMRAAAREAGVDLGAALDAHEARCGFMAAHGIDLARVEFAPALVRSLDYYDGFVFEARDADDPAGRPLVGGGRYDRLMTRLGAPFEVPAVGAAVFLDRLGGP
ncbi:MAG: ATP phosphoribosyltransferase regulatory subunit, partial [Hyphomicrobiales bacterium]|nr:ATP phosphoribosyltransferase regulatory subunit [Hyphomicrobiales bacterium]